MCDVNLDNAALSGEQRRTTANPKYCAVNTKTEATKMLSVGISGLKRLYG